MNDATKAEKLAAGRRRGGEVTKARYGLQHYKEISAMGGRATKGIKHKRKVKYVVPLPTTGVALVLDTLDAIMASLESRA